MTPNRFSAGPRNPNFPKLLRKLLGKLPGKLGVPGELWSAANGGLRDGGLSKSQDIWGKRPFSSVFWICQVHFAPSGKGRKRQEKGEKGRFRPISGKGGQTPLKPPFVTPPFAAAQELLRRLPLPWGAEKRQSPQHFPKWIIFIAVTQFPCFSATRLVILVAPQLPRNPREFQIKGAQTMKCKLWTETMEFQRWKVPNSRFALHGLAPP